MFGSIPRHVAWGALFGASLVAAGCSPAPAPGPRAEKQAVDKIRESLMAGAPAAGPAASSGAAVKETGWATIKGRFVLDGAPPTLAPLKVDKDTQICTADGAMPDEAIVANAQGQLRNVLVFVRNKVPVNPSYDESAKQEVTLDNKGCKFVPHFVVMRTSQTLLITDSDPVGHNTNLGSIFNGLVANGSPARTKVSAQQSLPQRVLCNIHPWMTGWLFARDDPYAVVSDASGAFEIKDLPAGIELEMQLWQEKAGPLGGVKCEGAKVDPKGRFKLKLEPGQNLDLNFVVSASALVK